MIVSWNEVSAESKLSSIERKTGSLYFCCDTGNMFLDSETQESRIALGKEILITSSLPIAPLPNKLYIVSKKLYIYTNEWICISGDVATQAINGLMSAEDKVKLDGIEEGATKVVASKITPKAPGTATVGTDSGFSRGDHVHPAQTTISGNAGSATKLKTARSIALSGAASSSAEFDGTSDITLVINSLDGTKITGLIPLSSIPKAALERLVHVANDTARLALTIDDVQNGDVIKVEDTELMYYVVDDSKLGTEDAFTQFKTGGAASVEWSAINNKPVFAAVAVTGSYNDLTNKYSLPAATSSVLGGVKIGANVTISGDTISLTKSNIVAALGYTPPTSDTTYSEATVDNAGLMSAEDKVKLDGIEAGANKTQVDGSLSDTSTNPVQNKVIKETIDSLSMVAVDENSDGNITIRKYISGEYVGPTIDDTLTIRGAAADAKAVGDLLGNVPSVDNTLTQEGAAADAKTVGDWMNDIVLSENNYGSDLPDSSTKGKIFFVEDTEEKYPIGSIYMSVNSTSPASLFGGTWEQIKDVFLLAAGSTYTAGSTGGEAAHTLTKEELPNATLRLYCSSSQLMWAVMYEDGNGRSGINWGSKNDTDSIRTEALGDGVAHNNMPPYLAVYMWKRVA